MQCAQKTDRDGCELTRSCPQNDSHGCKHGPPRAAWVGGCCVGCRAGTPGAPKPELEKAACSLLHHVGWLWWPIRRANNLMPKKSFQETGVGEEE